MYPAFIMLPLTLKVAVDLTPDDFLRRDIVHDIGAFRMGVWIRLSHPSVSFPPKGQILSQRVLFRSTSIPATWTFTLCFRPIASSDTMRERKSSTISAGASRFHFRLR